MNRLVSVAAITVLSALLTIGSVQASNPDRFPIAEPGTECFLVIVSSPDSIRAKYEGNSASYSNDLYLMLDADGNPGDDGILENDLFIFNNHETPVGTTMILGAFEVGVELIFRLHVRNTGYDFQTGPGDRNPDGHCHARVQGNWEPNTALASFEDLYNGPFGFDDLSFSFTNVGTVECPDNIAFQGVYYESAIVAVGGTPPYVFSIDGELPDGLVLNADTGGITGIPTTVGIFDFTGVATDANGIPASAECQIIVEPGPTPIERVSWSEIKSRYR